MAKNIITILDNEIYLRKTSQDVDFMDKSYLHDIYELEQYCRDNAVWAMASIQIGIPKRIIYIKNTTGDMKKNFDPNYDEAMVLINPVVLERKGHTRFLEGCASCLDLVGVVDRPYLVEVEYYDIDFNLKKTVFKGFEATVFSHEFDHLNGVLHLDLINKASIMHLNLTQVQEYRDKYPYLIISKTCDFDSIK